jgi:hypothetical protein
MFPTTPLTIKAIELGIGFNNKLGEEPVPHNPNTTLDATKNNPIQSKA